MKSDFGTWLRKERFPDVSANIALAMFRTSDSVGVAQGTSAAPTYKLE